MNEADLSIKSLQKRSLKWTVSVIALVCACSAQTYVSYAQTSVDTQDAQIADPYQIFLSAKRYHDGDGVAQDYAKARGLYETAASLGSKDAQINLGYMYFVGEGVPQDYAIARKWYLKAADTKAARANLAAMYEHGLGVEKDLAAAQAWRQKSAPRVDPKRLKLRPSSVPSEAVVLDTPVSQAVIPETTAPSVLALKGSQEITYAPPLYDAVGVQAEGADELFLSAKRYHDGDGVPQDFAKARYIYEKAASLGSSDAQINLGYMYFVGEGVAQDYTVAREWYLKASHATEAQTNLAAIYEHGLGVEKDLNAAQAWRDKSLPQTVPSHALEGQYVAPVAVTPPSVPALSATSAPLTSAEPDTPALETPVFDTSDLDGPTLDTPLINQHILDAPHNDESIKSLEAYGSGTYDPQTYGSDAAGFVSQTSAKTPVDAVTGFSSPSSFGSGHTGAYVSLDDALEAAFKTNPQILAARQQFAISETDISLAKSGHRPTIEANGSYGFLEQDSDFDDAPSSSLSGDTSNLGLSLTQPIFRGFQTRNSISEATSLSLAEQLEISSVEQNVFLEVATAYFGVQRDLSILKLNEENLETLNDQLEANQKRYELKDASLTDVARSQTAVASALSRNSTATSDYAATQSRFFRLTGLQAENLAPVAAPPTLLPSLAEFQTIVQERNASILSAQHALDASDFALKQAKGARLPTVDFNTSVNRNEGPVNFGAFNDDRVTTSASANVTVRVPLYQAGQEFGNIKRAQQVRRLREIELLQVNANVRDESRTIWDRLEATKATLSTAEAAVQASQTAAEGTRKIYRSGLISAIDLIDTEQTLLTAKTEYERAKHDHLVTLYTLLSLMGDISFS